MKRRSLLIDAGRACIDNIIDGCRQDVERMRAWLTSDAGGAWDKNEEIHWLHNPSFEDIEQGMRWVEKADFAFVTFSGHGQINEVKGKRRQVVYVGKGTCEPVDFSELKPNTSKCIVICDACREVHVQAPLRLSLTENVQRHLKAARAKFTRLDYKREYLRLLSEGDGRYTMYSCSPGQYSGDDENNGGRFTGAILDCAGKWFTDTARPMSYCTIGETFGIASPRVSRTSRAENEDYPQDPEAFSSIRGRSSKYPFVIHFE